MAGDVCFYKIIGHHTVDKCWLLVDALRPLFHGQQRLWRGSYAYRIHVYCRKVAHLIIMSSTSWPWRSFPFFLGQFPSVGTQVIFKLAMEFCWEFLLILTGPKRLNSPLASGLNISWNGMIVNPLSRWQAIILIKKFALDQLVTNSRSSRGHLFLAKWTSSFITAPWRNERKIIFLFPGDLFWSVNYQAIDVDCCQIVWPTESMSSTGRVFGPAATFYTISTEFHSLPSEIWLSRSRNDDEVKAWLDLAAPVDGPILLS